MTEPTEDRSLRVGRRGSVAEVVLTGPGKGNAMGPDFRREMPGLFTALDEEVAANPPLVVQGVKPVMDYCEDKSIEDGLRYVAARNSAFLQSKDLREAVSAFMERRAPSVTGR